MWFLFVTLGVNGLVVCLILMVVETEVVRSCICICVCYKERDELAGWTN